ncbi:MarR family transcriptional regulator [Duganella sp. FT50W]|uniref:MarR family transcriptional regulator n=1 Tax=Duganella lactea TaxID=2692173 RepID=A0A6L8MGA8_9BURK|nr:MarR family transcriptional regulator [Duganella lactea]MYM33201.1 MarR family transcriptional regulator [Duganella lactea]MYM82060.1 MarR family transcriptional regulator [Duganella lactea]
MNNRANRAAADWSQQRPELDAKVMALAGRLLEASQLLERHWLNPLAAQFELHPGEFDVIATLRRSGAPYALTPTALYERLMLSSGAMTSRLDRLERKGLTERAPAPGDRRSILVRLTPAGLALIDKLLPLHIANEHQALSALGQGEQDQLDALLAKLITGLNAER